MTAIESMKSELYRLLWEAREKLWEGDLELLALFEKQGFSNGQDPEWW